MTNAQKAYDEKLQNLQKAPHSYAITITLLVVGIILFLTELYAILQSAGAFGSLNTSSGAMIRAWVFFTVGSVGTMAYVLKRIRTNKNKKLENFNFENYTVLNTKGFVFLKKSADNDLLTKYGFKL